MNSLPREIQVLLVEDDQAYAGLVERMLAESQAPQYVVSWAASLGEGLDFLGSGAADLVLLDLVLPDSSGLNTLTSLRQASHLVPVVVLTGMAGEGLGRQALAAGAAEYLRKDEVSLERLLRTMSYALERSRAQRELLSRQDHLEEVAAQRERDLMLAQRHLEGEAELRAQTERELRAALADVRQKSQEAQALLEGARTLVQEGCFERAARRLFDIARQFTGATAGYVAMLSDDGQNNEVLFLEAGGRPCSVDPDLPMPIRGLRESAYRFARVAWHNDFAQSQWADLMPAGHVRLDNVLFAPILRQGLTVGIMGLANKPGPFDAQDRRVAEALGEMASVALANCLRPEDAGPPSGEENRLPFGTDDAEEPS